MTILHSELHISLTWHFFATSHRNGSVDGIVGEIIRKVWLLNLSGHVINEPKDFGELAKKGNGKTEVVYVPSEEIRCKQHEEYINVIWGNISAIPQTQNTHWVKSISPFNVQHAVHSKVIFAQQPF